MIANKIWEKSTMSLKGCLRFFKPRSWGRLPNLPWPTGRLGNLPHARRRLSLVVEWLEDRTLLCGNGSLETALAIDPGIIVEDVHADGSASYFKVTLPETGRLTILTQVVEGGA